MDAFDSILDGLLIFKKYGGCSLSAEHDEIFLVVWAGINAGPGDTSKVTKKDRKELEELGWSFDESFDCWRVFT